MAAKTVQERIDEALSRLPGFLLGPRFLQDPVRSGVVTTRNRLLTRPVYYYTVVSANAPSPDGPVTMRVMCHVAHEPDPENDPVCVVVQDPDDDEFCMHGGMWCVRYGYASTRPYDYPKNAV